MSDLQGEHGERRTMDLGELTDVFNSLQIDTSIIRPVASYSVDFDNLIYLASVGPDVTSTSGELVPRSCMPIWDVNGYYRAIGIKWPFRPTRGEMGKAYRDTDGQSRDYATYAFKQLLDPEFREHYDARPLGKPVDDIYRWEQVKRLASDWAAEQSRITGREVTIEDLLGEDVVTKIKNRAEAEAKEREHQERRAETGEEGREDALDPSSPIFLWPYAFYLWRSRHFDDKTLATWQQMLVSAFVREGLSLRVAVGYVGSTSAAAVRARHYDQSGDPVQILFLHENHVPSQKLADDVVATYYNYEQTHTEPINIPAPGTRN